MKDYIEIIDGIKFEDSRLQSCDKGYYHVTLQNNDDCPFLSKHRRYEKALQAAIRAAKDYNAKFEG